MIMSLNAMNLYIALCQRGTEAADRSKAAHQLSLNREVMLDCIVGPRGPSNTEEEGSRVRTTSVRTHKSLLAASMEEGSQHWARR